jgi:aminomethyltransferase
MAEFMVAGPQAAAFLDAALCVDASAIPLSRAKYTMILAADGGILDDLIVYQNAPGEYLVVANAGNHDVVAAALAERIQGFEAVVTDLTEALALIAVQGPNARAILEATAGLEQREEWAMGHTLDELPYYACMGMSYEGAALLVARTGYTGEDGFELYVEAARAAQLWDALTTAGAEHGLVPCGLAARDTLRLEAGMPLYGHELGMPKSGPRRRGLPGWGSRRPRRPISSAAPRSRRVPRAMPGFSSVSPPRASAPPARAMPCCAATTRSVR